MRKALTILLLTPIAAFLALAALGAFLGPAEDDNAAAVEACRKMMADAQLGADRQMTRQVCERVGWRD